MFTYRWSDEAQTTIARSDGVYFQAQEGNAEYDALLASEAGLPDIAPYRRYATLDLARTKLTSQVESIARDKRSAVVGGADALKIAVYQEKYNVAVAALAGDADALAKLEPEATARGETATALAMLVKALGDAWRAAGLAIDAACQAHKEAINELATLEAAEVYDTQTNWPQ